MDANNTSTVYPCQDVEQYLIYTTTSKILFSIGYLLIFLTGIAGNTLVVMVVLMRKHMKSTTNVYIVNLAVADILMCLVSVPVTPLSTFMDSWIFGEVLCKVAGASQGTSVYMSTFTLTAIAIDRYRTIIHPFSSRPNLHNTIIIIIILDIVAVMVTLPYALFMELIEDPTTSQMVCQESWEQTYKLIYGGFTNITQFVFPFITIIISYISIVIKLRERTAMGKPGSRSAKKRMEEEARTRRTNRMLIAMVVIFGTSWFPINLINLLHDCIGLGCWSYYYVTFFLSHIIAMSSTCYNPILYGWLNLQFRTEFARITPCLSPELANSRRKENERGDLEMRTDFNVLLPPVANTKKELCDEAPPPNGNGVTKCSGKV